MEEGQGGRRRRQVFLRALFEERNQKGRFRCYTPAAACRSAFRAGNSPAASTTSLLHPASGGQRTGPRLPDSGGCVRESPGSLLQCHAFEGGGATPAEGLGEGRRTRLWNHSSRSLSLRGVIVPHSRARGRGSKPHGMCMWVRLIASQTPLPTPRGANGQNLMASRPRHCPLAGEYFTKPPGEADVAENPPSLPNQMFFGKF